MRILQHSVPVNGVGGNYLNEISGDNITQTSQLEVKINLKNEIISCSEPVESMGRYSAMAKRKATISFVTPVLPQVLM